MNDCISKGADYGERKVSAGTCATGYGDYWIDRIRELFGFCSRIYGSHPVRAEVVVLIFGGEGAAPRPSFTEVNNEK